MRILQGIYGEFRGIYGVFFIKNLLKHLKKKGRVKFTLPFPPSLYANLTLHLFYFTFFIIFHCKQHVQFKCSYFLFISFLFLFYLLFFCLFFLLYFIINNLLITILFYYFILLKKQFKLYTLQLFTFNYYFLLAIYNKV